MKLIVAIINNDDANAVTSNLTKAGYSATRLNTSGGFLRAGNSTLFIGTEDEKVDEIIAIIKETCSSRTQTITAPSFGINAGVNMPMEVVVGGATIFVLDVEQFYKI